MCDQIEEPGEHAKAFKAVRLVRGGEAKSFDCVCEVADGAIRGAWLELS